MHALHRLEKQQSALPSVQRARIMQRTERIVVQLLEARRFVDERSLPYARLALLLLDNLAEVLLYREVEHKLHYAAMFRNVANSYRRYGEEELRTELDRDRQRLVDNAVSKRRERKIRQYFDEKADYLVQEGEIQRQHARALKKLHAYRNEAYHRDTIRADTLQTAVETCFYLCCQLMKALPLRMISGGFRDSKYLRPFLKEDGFPSFDFPGQVADTLLEKHYFHHSEVNALLREHLVHRIEDMQEVLKGWSGDFPGGMSAEQLLRLCQVPDEAIESPKDVLHTESIPVPYDWRSFGVWKQRALAIRDNMAALEAFGLFANIEDDFETLEEQVMRLDMEMDRAVQHEIDLLRGK